MNDGTPLEVRVQEAFMPAVLIGLTIQTNKTNKSSGEYEYHLK
jgi:hypothetical protein